MFVGTQMQPSIERLEEYVIHLVCSAAEFYRGICLKCVNGGRDIVEFVGKGEL